MEVKFNMDIESRDDAFAGFPVPEVERIIRDVADKLRDGLRDGRCVDANGNTCGEWFFSAKED